MEVNFNLFAGVPTEYVRLSCFCFKKWKFLKAIKELKKHIKHSSIQYIMSITVWYISKNRNLISTETGKKDIINAANILTLLYSANILNMLIKFIIEYSCHLLMDISSNIKTTKILAENIDSSRKYTYKKTFSRIEVREYLL